MLQRCSKANVPGAGWRYAGVVALRLAKNARCSQTSGPSDGRMQSVFDRAVRSSNTERDPVNDRQIELGARVCAYVRTA